MADFGNMKDSSDVWYARSGSHDDVVVSTRIRLARNLANFPFPGNFSSDIEDQIQSIVFDSFSHIPQAEKYQTFPIKNLEEVGKSVLIERGLISEPAGSGLILSTDSTVSCAVNSVDHVRIAALATGLASDDTFQICHAIDDSLQQVVQFAASYDFGYLTASLHDAGSGMKTSLRVHLPSIVYMGHIQKIVSDIEQRGFSIQASFGMDSQSDGSLGNFYDVASKSSSSGNELDQLVALTSIGRYIIEQEHQCRQESIDTKPTCLQDTLYRAYALVKYSRFITLQESLRILSAFKWGRACGLMRGFEDADISALLFRVQNAHLQFLLKSGHFEFEKDIVTDTRLKIQRLRSLILQEAVENIGFIYE